MSLDAVRDTLHVGMHVSSSRGRHDGRQLLDGAERLASWLGSLGHPGPMVSAVGDTVGTIVTTLASAFTGMATVHIDPGDPNAPEGIHVRDVTSDESISGGYLDTTLGLRATRVGGEVNLDGVPHGAQIFVTSGTTSEPVLVVRDPAAILADARAVLAMLRYRADAPVVVSTPVHHAYGYTFAVLAPLLVGASVHYCGPRTIPSQLARAARQVGGHTLIAHPAHLGMLASQTRLTGRPVLAGIECVVSAGAPLPEGAAAVTANHDFTLYNCYGTSEAGAVTLSPVDGTEAPDDAGSLLPGVDARLAPGDFEAELLLRGPALASGYLTAGGLVPLNLTDGWLRTGDLARLDGDRIHLHGRIASIINVGGEKVVPEEVERVLASHPGVVDVQVSGAPDAVRGWVPVAHVVVRDGVTSAELLAWCLDRLAPAKVPRRFEHHGELSRSSTGQRLRPHDEGGHR